MLKDMVAIMRNNWAMEKAGIKTQSLDSHFRLAVHKFGLKNSMRPEEVAAFLADEEPSLISDIVGSVEIRRAWLTSGKIRPDVMLKAKMQFAMQGLKF